MVAGSQFSSIKVTGFSPYQQLDSSSAQQLRNESAWFRTINLVDECTVDQHWVQPALHTGPCRPTCLVDQAHCCCECGLPRQTPRDSQLSQQQTPPPRSYNLKSPLFIAPAKIYDPHICSSPSLPPTYTPPIYVPTSLGQYLSSTLHLISDRHTQLHTKLLVDAGCHLLS